MKKQCMNYEDSDYSLRCINAVYKSSDYCAECLEKAPWLDGDAAVDVAAKNYRDVLKEISIIFRTEEEFQVGLNPWALANEMAELAEKALGYPVYGQYGMPKFYGDDPAVSSLTTRGADHATAPEK